MRALQRGADDYVTKPFGRQELLARDPGAPAPLGRTVGSGGDVRRRVAQVDFAQRSSRSTARRSPHAARVQAARRVRAPLEPGLEREQLLELVWGDSRGVSLDQVKLYVGYLRRKLGGPATRSRPCAGSATASGRGSSGRSAARRSCRAVLEVDRLLDEGDCTERLGLLAVRRGVARGDHDDGDSVSDVIARIRSITMNPSPAGSPRSRTIRSGCSRRATTTRSSRR